MGREQLTKGNKMHQFFTVGDKVSGFCNGFFSRGDYYDKICVLVSDKYAVFQWLEGDLKGEACVINNPELLEKIDVSTWKV